MNGRFSEYVLGDLKAWRQQGKRAALLTLYNTEPTGPRPTGSQMAISDAGDFTGFLSGGCVEGALVEETKAAIAEGVNRSIRYGVNSPYFDIALPCGSAIDVFIDVGFSDDHLDTILAATSTRQPMQLIINMENGTSNVTPLDGNDGRPQLVLDGGQFNRLYRPPIRLVIAGKGPVIVSSTEIARASDIEVTVITSEDDTAAQCESLGATVAKSLKPDSIDEWTAVATLFHEHELEGPVLSAALDSGAFYIGALGSRVTHAERVERFLQASYADTNIARIKGPLGISIGSRNPPEIAISMVAEVLQVYRQKFPV